MVYSVISLCCCIVLDLCSSPDDSRSPGWAYICVPYGLQVHRETLPMMSEGFIDSYICGLTVHISRLSVNMLMEVNVLFIKKSFHLHKHLMIIHFVLAYRKNSFFLLLFGTVSHLAQCGPEFTK